MQRPAAPGCCAAARPRIDGPAAAPARRQPRWAGPATGRPSRRELVRDWQPAAPRRQQRCRAGCRPRRPGPSPPQAGWLLCWLRQRQPKGARGRQRRAGSRLALGPACAQPRASPQPRSRRWAAAPTRRPPAAPPASPGGLQPPRPAGRTGPTPASAPGGRPPVCSTPATRLRVQSGSGSGPGAEPGPRLLARPVPARSGAVRSTGPGRWKRSVQPGL